MTSAPAPPAARGRHAANVAFVVVAALSAVILFAPEGDGRAPFPYADKVVHLSLFALVAAATRWRFGARVPALALVCAYAPLSEIVQWLLLPHRDGDWHDAVADLLGVALGWAVAQGLLQRRAQDSHRSGDER